MSKLTKIALTRSGDRLGLQRRNAGHKITTHKHNPVSKDSAMWTSQIPIQKDRKTGRQEIYWVEWSLWLVSVSLLIIEVLLPNICLRFCVWCVYLPSYLLCCCIFFCFFSCLIVYHCWIKMNNIQLHAYTIYARNNEKKISDSAFHYV